MLFFSVSSGSLAEVELALLSEWFEFITTSQKIDIDLFG